MRMVKARTLYVWEGPHTFTITRGYEFERYETSKGWFYRGDIKHRGILNRFIPVRNIPEVCFGESKKLFNGKKILDGWDVRRVKMDFATKDMFITDVPTSIMAKIESLMTELNMWKKRCYDVEDKMMSIDNKDLFHEKIKKTLKFAGEAKNLLNPYNPYGYDNAFGSRWGLGGSSYSHSSDTD